MAWYSNKRKQTSAVCFLWLNLQPSELELMQANLQLCHESPKIIMFDYVLPSWFLSLYFGVVILSTFSSRSVIYIYICMIWMYFSLCWKCRHELVVGSLRGVSSKKNYIRFGYLFFLSRDSFLLLLHGRSFTHLIADLYVCISHFFLLLCDMSCNNIYFSRNLFLLIPIDSLEQVSGIQRISHSSSFGYGGSCSSYVIFAIILEGGASSSSSCCCCCWPGRHPLIVAGMKQTQVFYSLIASYFLSSSQNKKVAIKIRPLFKKLRDF